jgi:DNA polymerase-3 subunit epsilon
MQRENLYCGKDMGENVTSGWSEWLPDILQTLQEGVIVCAGDGRIVFANQAVQQFFPFGRPVGTNTSIYDICTRDAIEQTRDFLQQHRRAGKEALSAYNGKRFACALCDSGVLIDCRLSLLPPATGLPAGFVMLFDGASPKDGPAEQPGSRLWETVETLREPLANLRAAAENLVTHPNMVPVMRSAFENVIAQESVALSGHFAALAEESRALAFGRSLLVDMYSKDLVASLQYAFRNRDTAAALVEVGTPHWLQADGRLLLRCLVFFVERIMDLFVVPQLEIETVAKAKRLYLDLIWTGQPVPAAEIEAWRGHSLSGGPAAAITVAEVLARHNSDVWSSLHERPGRAMVRIPVPASSRQAV